MDGLSRLKEPWFFVGGMAGEGNAGRYGRM